MPLPVKVRAKVREALFVDRYRAKVTASDISGNRSDKFNPNVSAGPQCSQEFFPFRVATADSHRVLCYVIHLDCAVSIISCFNNVNPISVRCQPKCRHHHFETSQTIGSVDMNFCTDIHVHQRMNPSYFDDPLTFHPVPSFGQNNFSLSLYHQPPLYFVYCQLATLAC